jgi:tRNA (guanine37-N1)-methyltransferase
MNISLLTVFQDLYDPFLKTSLIGRAQEKGLVHFDVQTFFSFVEPRERIDAPIFGHGSGMVVKPEVMEKAISNQENKHGSAFKVFFSPQGKKLNQPLLRELAEKIFQHKHLMLIAGRYEGMDARVEEEYADEIISVGDFVVMGGDVPAMLFLEGLLRLMPGIVGKQDSVEEDSFSGAFVDYPVYTTPLSWKDKTVPEILRSGNHAAIKKWQMAQAAHKTVLHHFEWLRSHLLNEHEKKESKKIMPNHYVVLMHGDVLIQDNGLSKAGTTSVTSIDIHDIARASKTYGVEQFFIVTPLSDQQRIVRTLLNFWQTGVGIDYNPHRHEAVNLVQIKDDIDGVIAAIEQKEGKKPLIIATSARVVDHASTITFFDQEKVWGHQAPILFVFGTGKGLTPELVDRCDYLLVPIEGFTEFNHLSVRSAVAIALDRWMGINIKQR